MTTSSAPATGTARSSRHTSMSGPPWPSVATPDMVFGKCAVISSPCSGDTLRGGGAPRKRDGDKLH